MNVLESEFGLPQNHILTDDLLIAATLDPKKQHPSTIVNNENMHTVFDAVEAICKGLEATLPDNQTFLEDTHLEDYGGCPLFFGHYALDTTPCIMTPHIACVDYLTPTQNRLVAYRWQGEKELINEHFLVCEL